MAAAAAELLEAAKRHLEREQCAECEDKAREAADGFRAAGDIGKCADALRLRVLCYCHQGMRREAAHLAEQEWANFQEKGLKVGVAKMLLALSEANSEDRGPTKRLEAFRAATEALSMFRALEDKKMQGAAMLALANVYMSGVSSRNHRENLHDALELSQDALMIFQSKGDLRLQAQAAHAVAAAQILTKSFEAGLRSAKVSLGIYQELDLKRSMIYESQCIAEWLLEAGMPKQAQPYAEDALALSKQAGCGSAWEASAASTLVHVLLARDEEQRAMQVAQDGLRKFQDGHDRQGEALMLDLLINVHLAQDNPREALDVAERALAVAKDSGQKEHETRLLRAISEIHLQLQECDQAVQAARSSLQQLHQASDCGERVASLGSVAGAHRARQGLQEALQAAQEQREAFRRAEDARGEAAALLAVAALHAEMGDGQGVVAAAQQAQALFREAGSARGQAAALQMAAQAHLADKRHEVALRMAQEAIPLLREVGDAKGEAGMLVLVAQVSTLLLLRADTDPSTFTFLEGADKATKVAKDAVAVSRKAGENGLVASALCAQAQGCLMCAKGEDAVKAAGAAMAIFRGGGDQHGEAYALVLHASGLLTTDKSEKARKGAGKALALFREVQDEPGAELAERIIHIIDDPPTLEGTGANAEQVAVAQAAEHQITSAALENTQLVAQLKGTVRETVNAIVGLDDIQDDTPLMQTGLTSQSAVLLRNALNKELPGNALPFTMMFDYPSITHLTEFFLHKSTE